MKKIIVLFLSVLLLVACGKKETAVEEYTIKYEDTIIKAVWFSYVDYRDHMQNLTEEKFKNKVDTIIDNCKTSDINTIYLHAVSFTDSFYASNIYPKTNILPNIDYDPLKIFIEKAHKNNIRVEAWINPMRSFTLEEIQNVDDNFIIKKWITENKPYVKAVKDRYYLNPAYPETTDLILSVVQEIIDNYAVDGIHMDDYFYPEGIDENFDKDIYSKICTNKCTLEQFRKNNVNNLVAQINKLVKKSNLIFGISPSGNMDYSINSIYGDFNAWVDAGTVDYLIPQIYWGYNHPTKPYLQTLEEWSKVTQGSDVDLIIGIAGYKVGYEDLYAKDGKNEWVENTNILSRQTEDAKKLSLKGVSIFSYKSIFIPEPEVENNVKQERENLINTLKEYK